MTQAEIWYAEYMAWSEQRRKLSARENGEAPDGAPSASEWQRSDDTGIALLESAAAMLEDDIREDEPVTRESKARSIVNGRHVRSDWPEDLDGRVLSRFMLVESGDQGLWLTFHDSVVAATKYLNHEPEVDHIDGLYDLEPGSSDVYMSSMAWSFELSPF